MKGKILAIIPARGGSKGIPGKNIKELNEKPLMAYTIGEALKCLEIDRVVVSTDSKEIAQVAEKYGAEVPFMRPAQLAADTSKTIDAVWDVLDRLEEDYEYVVLLQPTSPLRLAEDITGAIQKAVETGKDVVPVSKVQDPPVLMRQMDENGELTPLLTEGSTVRRQDMKYQGNEVWILMNRRILNWHLIILARGFLFLRCSAYKGGEEHE